jgi:hypothetical protein
MEQLQWIKDNQHRALHFFIPQIDRYFAPLLPGQLCTVIAQTSNYKSGFLHAWEAAAAKQLEQQDRLDEVIVHVSVEEAVEEQAMLLYSIETGEDAGELARGQVQDWSRIEEAAIRIGQIPIYRIGHSLARADDMPNLYMSNMVRAIKYLQSDILEGKRIAGLFFDYLQAFPFDPEIKRSGMEAQRRLQVRADIYRLRYAAAFFKCPAIVAVQAKQVLTGSTGPLKIPGIYDGEESSSIAQRTDRSIQLWMPKTSYPVGYPVDHNGFCFNVADNHLFVKVGKQRGRLPAGKTWECYINFQSNTIAPAIGEAQAMIENQEYVAPITRGDEGRRVDI